jgi:hypothetical protein
MDYVMCQVCHAFHLETTYYVTCCTMYYVLCELCFHVLELMILDFYVLKNHRMVCVF